VNSELKEIKHFTKAQDRFLQKSMVAHLHQWYQDLYRKFLRPDNDAFGFTSYAGTSTRAFSSVYKDHSLPMIEAKSFNSLANAHLTMGPSSGFMSPDVQSPSNRHSFIEINPNMTARNNNKSAFLELKSGFGFKGQSPHVKRKDRFIKN
jgi:hypothetical protein